MSVAAGEPARTLQKIADALKAQIDADPKAVELSAVAEIMPDHGVSRGVVLRVFAVLQRAGAAEPVPGGRWRVLREGQRPDRRPLAERPTDVFMDDDL
ncbi:hypothetical protein [Streptomyces sp. SID486]|uniref:hypothetical protein n=1 Tax=Streptomyces sp. SID486 TaxID=2690264 RepID=UPI001F26285D|nr:hypothetical protein [Streptomyces sp. SID486]